MAKICCSVWPRRTNADLTFLQRKIQAPSTKPHTNGNVTAVMNPAKKDKNVQSVKMKTMKMMRMMLVTSQGRKSFLL